MTTNRIYNTARDAIRAVLELKGITQSELAKAIGSSFQVVSNYLAGRRTLPEQKLQLALEFLNIKYVLNKEQSMKKTIKRNGITITMHLKEADSAEVDLSKNIIIKFTTNGGRKIVEETPACLNTLEDGRYLGFGTIATQFQYAEIWRKFQNAIEEKNAELNEKQQ